MLQLLGACSADAGRKIAEQELQSSHIGIQIQLFSYSIAASVSRAMLASESISFARAIDSAEKAPCFRAFWLPRGAPPPAPCILQTL